MPVSCLHCGEDREADYLIVADDEDIVYDDKTDELPDDLTSEGR